MESLSDAPGTTAADVVKRSGLSSSTVYRMLGELEAAPPSGRTLTTLAEGSADDARRRSTT